MWSELVEDRIDAAGGGSEERYHDRLFRALVLFKCRIASKLGLLSELTNESEAKMMSTWIRSRRDKSCNLCQAGLETLVDKIGSRAHCAPRTPARSPPAASQWLAYPDQCAHGPEDGAQNARSLTYPVRSQASDLIRGGDVGCYACMGVSV